MADTKQNEQSTEEKKNKKIGKMTLKEIESVLDLTLKNQGSLKSKYALELLKQKAVLSKKQ